MNAAPRFMELISKLLDDQLADHEVAALQVLLRDDPSLRNHLVDHLLLDTLLEESLGQEPLTALVDTVSAPLFEPQLPARDSFASQPRVEGVQSGASPRLRLRVKRWGWLAVAAALIVLLGSLLLQSDRSAIASATQLVQAAIHTHAAAIERIYVVEVKRGATNDSLMELPRDVRVVTQGDKFWVQMRGQREWAWGRDEQGAVWMTLGSRQAVVVNPEEMGMPLRYIGDLYTLNVETLLKSFLKYCQLERSDGAAESTIILATPRRQWSNRPLKRATIEVDRETKAIRKLVIEREVDGSSSVSTFILVDARPADESLYGPEGHLTQPFEIFGTETQIDSRRERVMSWFGSRADRWVKPRETEP